MKDIESTCWRILRVPDEGYWEYLMKVIERTLWRLLRVPYEGYWAYLMKVIERTLWRLLSVPYEGYWAYLMKVIESTWWRLLSVPYESYWAYLMKVIERTLWRLFQKRVVCTKLEIYLVLLQSTNEFGNKKNTYKNSSSLHIWVKSQICVRIVIRNPGLFTVKLNMSSGVAEVVVQTCNFKKLPS
jgi:hypothetical protein